MRDCSNCPKKPAAGSVFSKTPCASCKPWEPDIYPGKVISMPGDVMDAIFHKTNFSAAWCGWNNKPGNPVYA
jgi:hypothetical protein